MADGELDNNGSSKSLTTGIFSSNTQTSNVDLAKSSDSNPQSCPVPSAQHVSPQVANNMCTGTMNSPSPNIDPQPGQCNFYIYRKKRCCKMDAKSGTLFCASHSQHVVIPVSNQNSDEVNVKKRIPCPLDPKHTCFEDRIETHLIKCNASKIQSKSQSFPYFVENINRGSDEGEDPNEYKVSIRNIPDSEVLELVETVRKLHKEHVDILQTDILFHELLRETAETEANGAPAQKHIQQLASLLGHVEKAGLCLDNCSYVEFGAGRGGLSHWVQLAQKDVPNNQYILVEKGSVRYKKDNFHKGANQGPTFERVKIDIKDLDLGKVPSLENDSRPIVGIGKHVCGGATDLMLRCLLESPFPNRSSPPVSGVVLALCCHHRCDWRTYVGKAYFTDTLGLSARTFHLLTSMTSWGTCGAVLAGDVKVNAKVKVDAKVDAKDDGKAGDHDDEEYCHHRYGSLTPDERELIGRQCKQLIDAGRRQYLLAHGFSSKIVLYVNPKHTIENMALIANRIEG